MPDVGDGLQFRQVPVDEGGFGDEHVLDDVEGAVGAEHGAVGDVEERGERVEEGVGGEFFELEHEEVEVGVGGGAEDGGAGEGAEEEAGGEGGGVEFFVGGVVFRAIGGGEGGGEQVGDGGRGKGVVVGVAVDAEGGDAHAGVDDGEGAVEVAAVGDDADEVGGAGGRVGEDFRVEFVDLAKAVLHEADGGVLVDAVFDGL